MQKTITTPEQFRDGLKALIASTDFNLIGQVKDHQKETVEGDPKSKVPTGEVFLTGQIRMPSDVTVCVADEEYFPSMLTVKFDAFKLSAVPKSESAKAARPATANADVLRNRLKGANPAGTL